MQGVRVKSKQPGKRKQIRVWCWLGGGGGWGGELQRCFLLPKGKVSSLPGRNRALQLTREPLRKKKRGNTLRNEKVTHVLTLALRLKCVCKYPRATPAEVRCSWGRIQRCAGFYTAFRRGDGRRSIGQRTLPLSRLLFARPGPRRQRLPAAPSVAAKCPKFISVERRGRWGAETHKESDTQGGKGEEGEGPADGSGQGSRRQLLRLLNETSLCKHMWRSERVVGERRTESI